MNGTLAGFTALLIWASSATLVAFIGRLPPLEVTAFTWLVASIALTGAYLVRGQPIMPCLRRPLSDYVFVTFGVGVYTALYYIAFKHAPVFEANALNYLWPIFLMLFISIFQKAPVTLYTLAGMALGFGGCALLFMHRSGGEMSGSFGLGHVVAIIAALIWAFYSCFSRSRHYPVGFLIPVFIISGIGTFAAHLAFEDWIVPTNGEWWVILLLGLARLGYVFWDYAMRHGNQALITSASYFTPLSSTILLAAAGFGAANGSIALAAGLIIVGCLIVNGESLKRFVLRWKKS